VKCSLKLREVFKDKKCVLCKEMLDEVVVTAVSDSKFHDLNVSKMKVDRQTGIRLDSNISSQVLDVLKFRCPICVSSSDENARPFRTVRALKAHAARDHEGKMFCDLCLQNRKVFPHEQRLYTYDELKIHMKRGDPPRDGSGALAPHPRCKFWYVFFFFFLRLLLYVFTVSTILYLLTLELFSLPPVIENNFLTRNVSQNT